MKERAREEELPADRVVSGRHVVEPFQAARGVQFERPGTEDGETGRRAQHPELPLQSRGHCDVVGIEPRDVAPPGRLRARD